MDEVLEMQRIQQLEMDKKQSIQLLKMNKVLEMQKIQQLEMVEIQRICQLERKESQRAKQELQKVRKMLTLDLQAVWQRLPRGEQDMQSILQEKLKTLPEMTADQRSMPSAKQEIEGVPRELDEVSGRMEDASKDG
jgi:hypothetical protein